MMGNASEQREDAPPPPQESLEIIEESRARLRRVARVEEWPVVVAWGLAWVAAFGYTAGATEGAPPLLDVPGWTVGVVWLVAIGAAVVWMSVYYPTRGRGFGGASAEIGRLTGWAWSASFAAAFAIVVLLDLQGPQMSLLFVFTVSALYMGQAAHERDLLWFGLGVWLGLVNVAAFALLADRYSTTMMVAGGGGLLVGGWLARRRSRAAERVRS
jgi:hypothetical protein